MRISVLYNRSAGDRVPLDRIRDAVEQHGHDLICVIETPTDVKRLLDDCPELVVAAGGDGTISRAAPVLARRGVPLAILPLGTANNIAKSLGIQGSIDDLVAGWITATRVSIDLGVAEGAWGRRVFVEAAGGGLIPAAFADMQTRSDGDELPGPAKVAGAVRATARMLSQLQPVEMTIVVDGAPIRGNFLLAEVLNIRSIGPNLILSPDATPSDGLFHVVMASDEYRDEIARYLQDALERRDCVLSLPSTGARHLTFQSATDIHLDDEVLSASRGQMVSMHIDAGALELLA